MTDSSRCLSPKIMEIAAILVPLITIPWNYRDKGKKLDLTAIFLIIEPLPGGCAADKNAPRTANAFRMLGIEAAWVACFCRKMEPPGQGADRDPKLRSVAEETRRRRANHRRCHYAQRKQLHDRGSTLRFVSFF